MAYSKINFKNDNPPAINAENLNHMQTQYDEAKAELDTHSTKTIQGGAHGGLPSHTHTKSQITDFSHTHVGSDVTSAVANAINADQLDSYHANTGVSALTIPIRDVSGNIPGNITGNAATATKLQTSRTISLVGDATGSASFDGSANATITTTLSNSGVTAGTYKSVTVDGKGRVTAGSNPTTLAGFGITDAVQNAGSTPSIQAGADASKPTAGTAGRIYVTTDTFRIYRDTGSAWQLVGTINWDDITNKPSNFTPSVHKSTHASGGADALTPADIGAASASDLTTHTNRTDNPHVTTAAQVGALVSINSVSNPGGNVDLVPGVGIAITPDNTNKRITFDATGETAPAPHASTHATGGSDPVTPASIGAAPSSHTHTRSQVTDFAHKSTHATGGSDALTPADIGAAAASDFAAHLAESAIHKTSDVIRTETKTKLKVEVVSSSGSETPEQGRIIFDMSQGKFFGGNGSGWV